MNYESARTVLARHNQSHLLQFWDELKREDQETLLSDIAGIDFESRTVKMVLPEGLIEL